MEINKVGRYCSGCSTFKEWEFFSKSKIGTVGHASRCKVCNGEYNSKYHKEESKKIYERHRSHRLENIGKYSQKEKNQYIKRKPKIAEYVVKRRRDDTNVRITHSLRNRLLYLIKRQKLKYRNKYCGLVSCSTNQLITYIESLWEEGMDWDNHGIHGWHIDHIKPCCTFDLTDPIQQKRCFHYTNLQPLWAKDNSIKRTENREFKKEIL